MLVFIDGENFRQLLVATLEKEKVISKTTPFKIDLVGLFKELLKTNNIRIKYYLSQIKLAKGHTPTPEIQKQVNSIRIYMRKWSTNLNSPNIKIIVVSSDADLCPAYHKIKKHNTKISYICFPTFRNMAVSASTDKTILIPTELLKKYISAY